jgi:hypothetical protein
LSWKVILQQTDQAGVGLSIEPAPESMKIIMAVVVAAILSFIGGWVASSYQQSQNGKNRAISAQSSELASPANTLKEDLDKPGTSPVQTAKPTDGTIYASRALAKLSRLKPLPGSGRQLMIRQIIHQFETLTDYGYDSLPAIKEFLARYEDIDYPSGLARSPELQPDSEPANDGVTPAWARMRMRSDSILPASLRLGLIEVLKNIGGPESQKILADLMSNTGRGVEVSYAAHALQEMAPDQYRELAVSSAKDLLANPPKVDRPSRLDEHSQAYLMEVLAMYHDTSFAANAQHNLIGSDGKLDRNALDYINKTMKDQALPAITQAYKDQRMTNQFEKVALVNAALAYIGAYPQANTIFTDLVTNTVLPLSMRTMAIQNVASRVQAGNAEDVQMATQNLLPLFEEARGFTTDESVAQALDNGIKLMQDKLLKPAETSEQ